jgi:hypothetical protein
VRLFCLAADEHLLLCTMHHIVTDAWSFGVLGREIAALYEAAVTGAPSRLPEIAIQYADYAVWQRSWLRDEILDRQLEYWRRHLAAAPVLDFPSDRPRPARPASAGASSSFVLSAELSARLAAFSRSEGVTLFMTLLAGFVALLHRYTEATDIVIGTATANRRHRATEGLIGYFINMLALRTDVSGDPPFGMLVRRVRDVTLAGLTCQDTPLEKVIEALHPERARTSDAAPLFRIAFGLQNVPGETISLPGVTLAPVRGGFEPARFDLTLWLREGPAGIAGNWTYRTDLFDRSTIERATARFETILSSALADPRARLSAIDFLSQAEQDAQSARRQARDAASYERFASLRRTPARVP